VWVTTETRKHEEDSLGEGVYGSSRPLAAAAEGRIAPTAQQELGPYDDGCYSRP